MHVHPLYNKTVSMSAGGGGGDGDAAEGATAAASAGSSGADGGEVPVGTKRGFGADKVRLCRLNTHPTSG